MKCKDCKYRHELWVQYGHASATIYIDKPNSNSIRHIYCNNPKSEHYGKEIVRMDECDEAEE